MQKFNLISTDVNMTTHLLNWCSIKLKKNNITLDTLDGIFFLAAFNLVILIKCLSLII